MTMAELLRKLADLIDRSSAPEPLDQEETNVMVPPLQTKIELLKKSVGVDNVYDQDEDENELAILKKNAGIAAQIESSEDNDIVG